MCEVTPSTLFYEFDTTTIKLLIVIHDPRYLQLPLGQIICYNPRQAMLDKTIGLDQRDTYDETPLDEIEHDEDEDEDEYNYTDEYQSIVTPHTINQQQTSSPSSQSSSVDNRITQLFHTINTSLPLSMANNNNNTTNQNGQLWDTLLQSIVDFDLHRLKVIFDHYLHIQQQITLLSPQYQALMNAIALPSTINRQPQEQQQSQPQLVKVTCWFSRQMSPVSPPINTPFTIDFANNSTLDVFLQTILITTGLTLDKCEITHLLPYCGDVISFPSSTVNIDLSPPPSPATMDIFVKALLGKTISITCRPDHSVYEIQCMIGNREGIPPEQQRLIFAGHKLQEVRTLMSYNIQKDSSLHLVLILRGC